MVLQAIWLRAGLSRLTVGWLLQISMMLVLCSSASLSGARPADWYVWQSKLDRTKTLCSQTTPGEGWEKFSGPYLDARCEILRKKR